jgi:D-glycero-D-manno-heptose 1,7-bisphosphate phosphatase
MKLGVFIERDGILNQVRTESRHPATPMTLKDFRVNTDVVPLLHRLKAAGLLLFATTNQPGLSHGTQSRRELDRMHELLRRSLTLDDVLVCPHDAADHCPCRKPKPGLLTEAAFTWQLDLDHSFVISDKWQDAAAARSAGCVSLLIQSPWIGRVHRDFLLPDFAAAVEKVLLLRAPRRAAA